MTRPAVFPVETTLYHPIEGAYTFPAGSPDPGALWTEKAAGPSASKDTAAQAVKDLLAAEDRMEQLGAQLERQSHDLQTACRERDEAKATVAEAEERASQAESRAASAEAQLDDVVRSRDDALSKLQHSDAALAAAEARAEAAEAEAKGSAEKLAAFDGDGDGAPGGSKPKKAGL